MLYVVILTVLALAAGLVYWYSRRQRKANAAAAILADPNPIATWTYTPAEWQQAVADEFSWASADGGSAQVRICQGGIYVWSDSHSHVYELETGGKVVTFAGYLSNQGSPLKLRVRWKVVTYDEYENERIKYHKDDYRIPVPLREKDAAFRVVEFFTTRLQNNLDAYATVVPEDQPISLFGKDSF
jgi:hypothetical protein